MYVTSFCIIFYIKLLIYVMSYDSASSSSDTIRWIQCTKTSSYSLITYKWCKNYYIIFRQPVWRKFARNKGMNNLSKRFCYRGLTDKTANCPVLWLIVHIHQERVYIYWNKMHEQWIFFLTYWCAFLRTVTMQYQ